MKKRFSLATMAVLMALMGVVTYVLTVNYVNNTFSNLVNIYSEQQEKLQKVIDARRYIENHFVGEWTDEEIMDGAVRGMIEGLGDRWSHYLSAEENASYQESKNNVFVGIGVSAMQDADTGCVLITEVYPASPAMEAGLTARDLIVAVGGETVAELGYYKAIEMIRGTEGTAVSLTVRTTAGDEKTMTVMRRAINREVVTTRIYGTAGYVKILNFGERVDTEFKEAVDRLVRDGVESLIFDLRNNPGGNLGILVHMLDYLLPEGRLITTRNKEGIETPYLSGASCVDLPMVVLVNAESYSAAEFFAACMQEYERATVVGERTVGKGYAQNSYTLSDGSLLLLSESEYFLPSGKSLVPEKLPGGEVIPGGLTPDYEVVFTAEENKNFPLMTPEEDRQLQKALEVLGVVN